MSDLEMTKRTASPQHDINNNNSNNNSNDDNDDEDGVVVDIPIESAELGVSVPDAEELRTSYYDNNSGSSSSLPKLSSLKLRRRMIQYSIGLILVLVFFIGLSIGVRNKKERAQQQAAFQTLGTSRTKSTTGSNEDTTDEDIILIPPNIPRLIPNLEALKVYLNTQYDITFDDTDAAVDDNNDASPQLLAAEWMALIDPANVPLPGSSGGTIAEDNEVYAYRFLARYVMAVLYFATNGNDWNSFLFFLTGFDICYWTGIVFLPSGMLPAGIGCNENGLPLELYLHYNNLVGPSLPTELGLLTTLEEINLQDNEITSTIPTELCQLTELRSLNLNYNYMEGLLPDCIGTDLTNLMYLTVSNNDLEGELPSSFSNLASTLRVLQIDDNELDGNPWPLWQQMTSLTYLVASDNDFDGNIDHNKNGEFALQNLTNLQIFDVSRNNFQVAGETLPVSLFTMPNLTILDLSDNRLSGSLPTIVGSDQQHSALEIVSLYKNDIQGEILTSWLETLANVTHLDLSENDLTGPIPSEIGTIPLSNLKILFLSNNPRMSGESIPDTLLNLPLLEDLSLRNTNRTGALPTFLGNMPNMSLIDLSRNDMTGPIPTEWGQLTKLEYLLLNNNPKISGELPMSFVNLTNLDAVFLDGTNLTGDFSTTLCILPDFADEIGIVDKRHEVYADCKNESTTTGDGSTTTTAAGVLCECCHCCDPSLGGCSDPYVNQLDLEWESNFQRIFYNFTNETVYRNDNLFGN